MSYFSTICDLNSHIVDSDEILVAKIHQNYQSHNRMTKSFSGLPSISPSSNNEVVYNGPFIGRARALVDYTPSVYTLEFLIDKHMRLFISGPKIVPVRAY